MQELEAISQYVDDLKDTTIESSYPVYLPVIEELTGIYSESERSVFGVLQPTKEDVDAWRSWINKNADKIKWSGDTIILID